MLAEADTDRLGTTLPGGYRLQAVLGEGASGVVYAARHPKRGAVALKILDPHLAAIPEVVRRFVREARVAELLEHPVAVPVRDHGTTELGEPFLVMDLLRGRDLEAHVEERRVPIADALFVADRVLDLLCRAHGLGILHRDLKPANVFLEHCGSVRVLDFGVARLQNNAESSYTLAGAVLGTPAWMAPEQARGETVDARSDLWAVGALLFFLLTGEPVRSAPSHLIELALATDTPAPPLAKLLPFADSALAALVDQALAFDARDRFATAGSMQAALRRVYESLHGSRVPLRLPTLLGRDLELRKSRSERRRHPRVPSAFAVALHARRGARIGVCRSYAQSGLLVATPSRFEPGERIEVELPPSCTGMPPLRAPGRVIRVKSDAVSGLLSELTAIELEAPIPSRAHQRIAARLGRRSIAVERV